MIAGLSDRDRRALLRRADADDGYAWAAQIEVDKRTAAGDDLGARRALATVQFYEARAERYRRQAAG